MTKIKWISRNICRMVRLSLQINFTAISLIISIRVCITFLFFGTFIGEVRSEHDEYDSSVELRILGGSLANVSEFPYMVSIIRNGKHDCGGSVISEHFVLTAGHCIHKNDKYLIRVGTVIWNDGGVDHKVKEFIVHPQFMTPLLKNNDIALIKVDPPFNFTEAVQPLRLAKQGEEVPAGTKVWAAGWGAINVTPQQMPPELHKVELYTITNEECGANYSENITSQMLCAGFAEGGRDACFGDSGGPLVLAAESEEEREPVQVGLVSWGPEGACAHHKIPFGVYANVSALRDWIAHHAGV